MNLYIYMHSLLRLKRQSCVTQAMQRSPTSQVVDGSSILRPWRFDQVTASQRMLCDLFQNRLGRCKQTQLMNGIRGSIVMNTLSFEAGGKSNRRWLI